jgi:hypothetical protein
MGIFDGVLGGQGGIAAASNSLGQIKECTEDELQRQYLAMQANVYSQQLAQSMMNAKQAAINPFNPNGNAAYTMSMSNLSTLWRAKYGDEWVEVFDEDFWRDARARMSKAGMFEEAHGWFRLKEDV